MITTALEPLTEDELSEIETAFEEDEGCSGHRWQAKKALQLVHELRWLRPLAAKELLHSEDAGYRIWAASCLGNAGDLEALKSRRDNEENKFVLAMIRAYLRTPP